MDLSAYGIVFPEIVRNPSPAQLYKDALLNDHAHFSSMGALVTNSGTKTGRSPKDKRIIEQESTVNDIWWGDVNIKQDVASFRQNRQRAVDFFNHQKIVYVIDAYAGWDPKYRLKIRVICTRPYHALFMENMLIMPSPEELADFGQPDYVIYNAGQFPADPSVGTHTSPTSVCLDFASGEFVILGTQYAGEMKKGVFTIMNYLMPKRGVLSMHCSANEGTDGDVTLFFGLSGTGKTTLSTESHRKLIGDDEHCWTDDGIFNIEGGCYAKCINLSKESEPEIYDAIRFGTVLENVVYDPQTYDVDYENDSVTENTRAAYPLKFIPNTKIPAVGGHPKNIILLTCDAFGVLPPVSRLTPAQAMYHYISGYTAKVAGTEIGIKEPQPSFSACYGSVFLAWHPTKYAELLAEKMLKHGSHAWLVNTGWAGGGYGVGSRMSIKHTRAVIDAIHSGELEKAPTVVDPIFGFHVPTVCSGVPKEVLLPRECWEDKAAYDVTVQKLAKAFKENFAIYADKASPEILSGGPRVE
ncbi:MAG: phosphoenolpyruvate carboxykinase (ATP) [Planctomycetia bacterium]|nr:phosphoenolpyruvate carboxykinase (ATP) [Planctomycetia bacterium]